MFSSRVLSSAVLFSLLSMVLALAPSSRTAGYDVVPDPASSEGSTTRRSVLLAWTLTSLSTFGVATAANADTGAEVRGTAVTPFNGLAFQYRGSDYGGLQASDIDEPSVSYIDFMQRLKAGEVKFVEFFAPDGDKAYVTFVGQDGKTEAPIRIGEGYPIEKHDGYSSPAFAIRAVKNANVPYKFSVPALSAYKSS